MAGEKVKLCGLWTNETQDGKKYLSGGLTYGTKLLIFPNGYKDKPSDPDHICYIAKAEPREKRDEKPAPSFDGAPGVDDDDVPF